MSRLKKQVLDRIRAEGPLATRDFLTPKKKARTGWWEWKPAKRALEQLFMEGKLMVSERRGFAKIYDVSERVLPSNVNTEMPTTREYLNHLVVKAAQAHGLVREDQVSYLRRGMKKSLADECRRLLNDGVFEEIHVAGIERPYLALKETWEATLEKPLAPEVHVLSPFDNHVIQRERVKELFGFDYKIECYVPEKKRQYGYFCLPILKGDRFIGRLDAKAERAEKRLKVREMFIEKNVGRKSAIWSGAQATLKDFARFNGCDEIEKDFN